MDTLELSADVREVTGKRVRFLRRQGLIPANLYGPKVESKALQIDTQELQQVLAQGGSNVVISVKVNGEKAPHTAVIRGVQLDPRTEALLHVDLLQIDVHRVITAEVPLHLVGESPLSKGETMIAHFLSTIEMEGLPLDIPRHIEVDIGVLKEIDQEIRVRDLQVPPNIRVLTDADQLVAKATRARVEAKEELEEEAPAEKVEGKAEVGAGESRVEER